MIHLYEYMIALLRYLIYKKKKNDIKDWIMWLTWTQFDWREKILSCCNLRSLWLEKTLYFFFSPLFSALPLLYIATAQSTPSPSQPSLRAPQLPQTPRRRRRRRQYHTRRALEMMWHDWDKHLYVFCINELQKEIKDQCSSAQVCICLINSDICMLHATPINTPFFSTPIH